MEVENMKFVVVDGCIQYPTHDFHGGGRGGTISSFDTGYHVTILRQYNL